MVRKVVGRREGCLILLLLVYVFDEGLEREKCYLYLYLFLLWSRSRAQVHLLLSNLSQQLIVNKKLHSFIPLTDD